MTNSPLTPVPHVSLSRATRLVDELHRAAATVGSLSSGGRLSDQAIVTRHWTGPHRQTFDSLFANEMQAAVVARRALAAEAEAWRRWIIEH